MTRWWILAVVAWAAFGLRFGLERRVSADLAPAELRRSLREFPRGFFGPKWQEEDIELLPRVAEIAGVSDYVYRSYQSDHTFFTFYIGFVNDRARHDVHHPGVCYPAQGLALDKERDIVVPVPGTTLEATMTEFEVSKPPVWRGYSATTFYYNGKLQSGVWKLRYVDRLSGVPYYAIFTIFGDFVGSLEETRAFYTGLLAKAIPAFLEFAPSNEGDANPGADTDTREDGAKSASGHGSVRPAE